MITYFLLSIVLIVLTVLVTRSLRNRRLNTAGLLEDLQEVLHLSARIAQGRRLLSWARTQLDATQQRIDRLGARLRTRLPLPEDLSGSSASYLRMFLVACLGECSVAWLLNSTGQFGSLSAEAIAFASPLLAAGVIVLAHSVVHGAVMLGAKHRPTRQFARARVATVVFTAVALGSVWVVLAGRSISNVAVVALVADYGLHLCGIFIGLAGGAAYTAHTILSEHQALESDLADARSAEKDLTSFIRNLEEDIATHEQRLKGETPAVEAVGAPSQVPLKNVAALIVAAVLGVASSTFAQSIHAGGDTHIDRVLQPGTRDAISGSWRAPGSCEFLVDVSRSVDREARRSVLSQLADRDLATIVEQFQCKTIRASAFSDGAPFNFVEEIVVPQVVAPMPCTVGNGATRASELLYPRVKAAREAEVLEACETDHEKTRLALMASRLSAIDAAAQMLRLVARRPARGTCTGLSPAIQWAISRSESIWVVTDGLQSCPAANATTSRVGGEQRLFFLLIPAGNPEAEASGRFGSLLNRLAAEFEDAEVLFYSEITASTWASVRKRR